MASSSKQKTTMSKLNRERKLRERRLDKQAKKNARKQASVHQPGQWGDAQARDDEQLIPPPDSPLPTASVIRSSTAGSAVEDS